jgi:hypothetical protein
VDLDLAETRAHLIETQLQCWDNDIIDDTKQQLTDRARVAREVVDSKRRQVREMFRRTPDRDDLTPSQVTALEQFDRDGRSLVGRCVAGARWTMKLDIERELNRSLREKEKPFDLNKFLQEKGHGPTRPRGPSPSERVATAMREIAEGVDRLEAECRAAVQQK